MADCLEFSFDKSVAMKLAKKALNGKMAILSTKDSVTKVGTPPLMIVTLTFSERSVGLTGSPLLLGTAKNAIELEFQSYEEGGGSSSAPTQQESQVASQTQSSSGLNTISLENQFLDALLKYYDLKQKDLIPSKLFETKKKDIIAVLKKLNYDEPIATVSNVSSSTNSEQPSVTSEQMAESSENAEKTLYYSNETVVHSKPVRKWICDCGYVNRETDNHCRNCYEPRPKNVRFSN